MNKRKLILILIILLTSHLGFSQTVIRINAGGDSLTYQGKNFEEDFYFSTPSQIGDYTKQIPEIYKTERYGDTDELSYDFPVTNGNYSVALHFMESYFGSIEPGGTGSRVFDVSIEGTKVLDNFDIYDEVGADVASIKQFNTSVNDGILNIYFSSLSADGGADYAKISAIEVVETLSGGTSLWYADNSNLYYNQGNIGIGITNPGTDKLAVNGNIRAKEVKVETANWPDYVFEKDYPLLSLIEIQKFIEQHGHLPNVPSAKEIESNGQNLGEVNRLLLEKVEELTLYSIKLQKELYNQSKVNQSQQERLVRLERLIISISKN
ncbi:malectin [Maribacter sp. PR1]|uniref:Malectin n=1 Tax=Maribacter cobaltidurans TaxID=1178778 RepID=A0ABU7IZQ6_9FLAO|nr:MULTISPECIES: malectin [Maribacter]MDC6390952.1 malectin [Maribacter sp. PR1]MEE1978344.1 malectin [Maribacter cobaltidurans]